MVLSRSEQAALININTASAQQLEKLPGVGGSIAERIVAYRKQYGPFRRAEHLMMVRGISDRKFRELRALITVS
jgi:competence protein ComEA